MGKLDRHFGSSSSVFRPNAFVPATSNNESVRAKNGTAGTKMAVELTWIEIDAVVRGWMAKRGTEVKNYPKPVSPKRD